MLTRRDFRSGRKTIFFLATGLTVEAVNRSSTPHLDVVGQAGVVAAIRRNSASTLCETLNPVDGYGHGTDQDLHFGGRGGLPAMARRMGRTVAFYSDDDTRQCFNSDRVEPEFSAETVSGDGPATPGRMAEHDILYRRPDLCIVHLGSRGNRPKGDCTDDIVRRTEKDLGLVMNALSLFGLFGEYNIFVQGIDSDETETDDFENTSDLLWAACGPRIARNGFIAETIAPGNTVPTIAGIMRLPSNNRWGGRALENLLVATSFDMALKSVA